MRLSLIHNAAGPSTGKVDINKAVYVAMTTLDNTMAKNFVTKLVKEENFEDLQSGAKTLEDLAVNVSLGIVFEVLFAMFALWVDGVLHVVVCIKVVCMVRIEGPF